METLSVILVGDSPHKGPVLQNFDISFVVSLNKLLNKKSRRRWFETPSRPCDIVPVMQRNSFPKRALLPAPATRGRMVRAMRQHGYDRHTFVSAHFVIIWLENRDELQKSWSINTTFFSVCSCCLVQSSDELDRPWHDRNDGVCHKNTNGLNLAAHRGKNVCKEVCLLIRLINRKK